MKKIFTRLVICFLLFSLLFFLLPGTVSASGEQAGAFAAAAGLVKAYPEAGLELEQDGGSVFMRLDEKRLLFIGPSGCPSVSPDFSYDAPLCALFAQAYPPGPGGRLPEKGFDPGRTRNESLLRFLYGESAEAVRANCVPVPFLGANLLFNQRQGAARALGRVGKRLERLVAENSEIADWILPVDGTFYWRVIAGSKRLSAHSFGIAVDLNMAKGPYWRWSSAASPEVVKAAGQYPQAVVDAFEAEGFIWGGKWHAFDFMHFEYRPELIAPGGR